MLRTVSTLIQWHFCHLSLVLPLTKLKTLFPCFGLSLDPGGEPQGLSFWWCPNTISKCFSNLTDFFAHLFFFFYQVLSQENKSAFNDSVLLELIWVVLVIHQGQLLRTKTRALLPQLSSKCLNRKHILYYPCACFQSKSLFKINKDFSPRALPCKKVVTDGNTSLKDLMDVGSLGHFWERIVYSSPELC